jgi:UMF1 family MFS transporter
MSAMTTIVASEKLHRRIINAWCMYDWANSAFATTIMAAMLPPYFSGVAAANLTKAQASSIWGYASSLAMLLIALSGPVLGAIADYTGSRKRFMGVFVGIAIVFTGLLFFIGKGDWLGAVIFFVLASIGNSGANVFYDSLLPHVARPEEINQVSARGFAYGYVGGGLLLLVNLIWFMKPAWFGFADSNAAVRASFLSVAVWWAIFSVPIFRQVPEPPSDTGGVRINPVRAGFQRLSETFREIKQYRELIKFLVAFWIYGDGIGTIIRMATIYGAEIGIGSADLAGALLLTQIVAAPFAILFGWLPKKIGVKPAIYLALGVYAFISVAGYFMSQAWHFWVLAGMVGLVQGGSQALSRSLFGRMTPKRRTSEFYGFYDISSKFSGIVGPFLFGLAAMLAGSSRLAIVSLVVFFVVGGLLLSRVNEEKGVAVAQAEDAASRP